MLCPHTVDFFALCSIAQCRSVENLRQLRAIISGEPLRLVLAFGCFVSFLLPSAHAVALLKGVVVANEVSGPPTEDVQVFADGANPTTSNSSGSFALEFPRKRAGDTARILRKKDGYVVVNNVQVDSVLPANADDAPLTVILAKEEDREEMTRRLYRLS